MDDLTGPVGIVALCAAGAAAVALLLALVLAVKLRRLRSAQRAVLGATAQDDLVAHALGLQQAFEAVHARVEEVAERVDERLTVAESRIDSAIAYRALVRYDAYGELSGHQSTTLALLDAHHDGVVLSSILHRDTARMYCKKIYAGEGEHQLSPEESEAIRLALAGASHHSVTLD